MILLGVFGSQIECNGNFYIFHIRGYLIGILRDPAKKMAGIRPNLALLYGFADYGHLVCLTYN